VCESFTDLILKLGNNNSDAKEYELKLKKQILHQDSCRNMYRIWRFEFVWSKDEFLCVIHEKLDHAKIALLRFQVANKMIFGIGQLPINLTSMIVHGHGNKKYA
jgi:hypothetical protein